MQPVFPEQWNAGDCRSGGGTAGVVCAGIIVEMAGVTAGAVGAASACFQSGIQGTRHAGRSSDSAGSIRTPTTAAHQTRCRVAADEQRRKSVNSAASTATAAPLAAASQRISAASPVILYRPSFLACSIRTVESFGLGAGKFCAAGVEQRGHREFHGAAVKSVQRAFEGGAAHLAMRPRGQINVARPVLLKAQMSLPTGMASSARTAGIATGYGGSGRPARTSAAVARARR